MRKKAIILAGCAVIIGWLVVQNQADKICVHDNYTWHGYVDTVTGCKYDHEHGDDPRGLNEVFGEVGGWFGSWGQSVSYPWQTFKTDPQTTKDEVLAMIPETKSLENSTKHAGYKWGARRNLKCEEEYCVTDFRIQYHMHESSQDAAIRWHSASAEVRVCKDSKDDTTCGIVRTGGWFDFGRLIKTDDSGECWNAVNKNKEKTDKILLEGDSQYLRILNSDHAGLVDEFRCYQRGAIEWWGHGGSDFRFIVRVKDGDGEVFSDGHGGIHVKDTKGRMLEREVRVGYILPINEVYVGQKNDKGVVNVVLGQKYINRFGELVNGCVGAGLDCIPIEYSNIWTDPKREIFGFRQF